MEREGRAPGTHLREPPGDALGGEGAQLMPMHSLSPGRRGAPGPQPLNLTGSRGPQRRSFQTLSPSGACPSPTRAVSPPCGPGAGGGGAPGLGLGVGGGLGQPGHRVAAATPAPGCGGPGDLSLGPARPAEPRDGEAGRGGGRAGLRGGRSAGPPAVLAAASAPPTRTPTWGPADRDPRRTPAAPGPRRGAGCGAGGASAQGSRRGGDGCRRVGRAGDPQAGPGRGER